jgi:hypothetical protein
MPVILAELPWLNDHLIFWVAIVLICVVPSVSFYLYRWRKIELDAELKREMIARGMSADEIERVLAAGSALPPKRQAFEGASLKETQGYKQS